MLSARRAFQSETPVETMMAILQDDPPGLSGASRDMPAALSEIVAHCLEKSPEERFQTARDLAFALEVAQRGGIQGESGAVAPGSSPSEASPLPSIAVLPFRNMSSQRDAEYFSDGMTEEIINALTGIETLRVAARTSAFAFKGRDLDVRQIGRELGVKTVLEGSVRPSGQRIRVTAQLIDVATGYHLWSERYDREIRDVFAVQDEIARAIAGTLKVRLLGSEGAPLVSPATADVEAYNHYLKGRYYWNHRRIRPAIVEFEAAIARDPDYAAAHTGLADSYSVWGSTAAFRRGRRLRAPGPPRSEHGRLPRTRRTCISSRTAYVPPFDLALAQVGLGETDRVLTLLERAYDERNALLWFRIHSPEFDALRSEPRWKAMAARLFRTAPVNTSPPRSG